MAKILVTDPIAQEGIDFLAREAEVDVRLKPSPEELLDLIPGYDALIVRSETKVTREVIEGGKRLQAVGRAGTGVDNIDLEAATERGIIVVNAPLGNTISAAEHTIALMFGLARQLPEAYNSLRAGRWERQRFVGTELRGKTLGLIGMGQVGTEVARRARGLEMRVIAHDPYVAPDRAQSVGVDLVSLDELLAESDVISLHMRLTPQTRDYLDTEQLAKVKHGVRIINTARGELIDEAALIKAMDDGRVAGAAIDVFREEPPGESALLTHPDVLVTPHLGASTEEAQERAALDVAQEVLAVLRGEPARYAVNAPLVSAETMEVLRPFIDVAERTAALATQMCEGQLRSVEIEYLGDIAEHDVTPLKAAVIKGLLAPVSEENVTIVNANLIAERRGLRIMERKGPSEEFANLLSVHVHTDSGETTVAGSAFHDGTHIERVNDFWVDIPSNERYLLLCENVDRPGMIGAVGTLLGANRVNINLMHVSPPAREGGRALMVLGLRDPVPPEILKQLELLPDLYSARVAKI
jgi:D-3-phosphoglycerate dehydrogenase / 2-oxoglutarate reductase